jgi:hypothetical protein
MSLPKETLRIYSEKVIRHPVQTALFDDEKRFKVVAAGRRSGKTFTSKRKLVTEAIQTEGLYFAAAPTFPQAKAIFWDDLKAYFPPFFRSKIPNETRCELYLANGSIIKVIGLDSPARFEGQPWTGGLIDEIDDIKESAWQSNIRPALDTIGLNTWAILLGVPEGKYLLYDLSKKAAIDPDEWGFYHWKSSEILSPERIAAAQRDLSPLQYRQEYEASFETAEGVVYSDYCSRKNNSTMEINKDKPIQWTHDFNYSPLSSCIIQDFENQNHVVDEIILQSASAQNTAFEFIERYKNHRVKKCFIFGDYSGRNGENHNQSSDYKVIEKILHDNGWMTSRHVKPNPLIKNRQNSLRALICNNKGERRIFVNVRKCRYVDSGLSRTSLMKGSSYQEIEDEFQHITTALGYWAWTRFPILAGVAFNQSRG